MGKQVKRNYKDSLFRFIFSAPEHKAYVLSLYNSLNGSDYTDPGQMELITIDGALFLSVKNDVACLIADVMLFMEHQSTNTPNMPYRCLEYYMESSKKFIVSHGLRMHSSAVQKIPAPSFYVLYNGREEVPESYEMYLSDMFADKQKADIELTVHVLNINYGKNTELMENCRPLYEYAWLIDRMRTMVRGRTKEDLEWIVPAVLDAMPEDFILKGFLKENGEVVMAEFASNMTFESISEDRYEAGRQSGIQEGTGQKQAEMLAAQHAWNLSRGMAAEESVRLMAEMYSLSEEEVRSALEEQQNADAYV